MHEVVTYIAANKDNILWIGISTMSASYNNAKSIFDQIRNIAPEILLVIGGTHSSADHNECIHDGFDIAVIGEGEITAAKLTELLVNKKINSNKALFTKYKSELSLIDGIAYKANNSDVKLIPKTTYINDLDMLPMIDRTLIESDHYSKEKGLVPNYRTDFLGF